MPQWLSRVVNRVRTLTAAGRVRLTGKALEELAGLDIGLEPDDVCAVLSELNADDFVTRMRSPRSGDWLYVFKPQVAGIIVYLKIVVRSQCIVISFHEDQEE